MARDRIEGYKPHPALQRDFSLKAKPFLKEHGIDYDSKGYQNGGMFKVDGSNYWYDPDEEGFFTDKPDFEGYPYDEIVDLLKDTLGLNETDSSTEPEGRNVLPDGVSGDEGFSYVVGDYDDDFSNAHDRVQQKYYYRAMKDMKGKGMDVNDDASVEKLAEDLYNKDRKRVADAFETRQNLLKGIQDKML